MLKEEGKVRPLVELGETLARESCRVFVRMNVQGVHKLFILLLNILLNVLLTQCCYKTYELFFTHLNPFNVLAIYHKQLHYSPSNVADQPIL